MWPFTRGPSVRQQLADAHAYVATLQEDNAALIEHFNALHRQKETLLTADGIKQQTIDALTDKLATLQNNYDLGKRQYETAKQERDEWKQVAEHRAQELSARDAKLAEVTLERDARAQQLADAAAKRSDAISRGNRKRAETRRANLAASAPPTLHVQH